MQLWRLCASIAAARRLEQFRQQAERLFGGGAHIALHGGIGIERRMPQRCHRRAAPRLAASTGVDQRRLRKCVDLGDEFYAACMAHMQRPRRARCPSSEHFAQLAA